MIALALVLALGGSTSLYLASPHQRWRGAPLPARPARVAGGVLLVASLFAFTRAMFVVAAVYTWATCTMALLTLLTYAGAWKNETTARK